MHTQNSAKRPPKAFNPTVAAAAQRKLPEQFRIVKPYEGFRLNQVVYQYPGPTYGIEVEGEVPVTVTPNQGPFVGLTPDYLEKVNP